MASPLTTAQSSDQTFKDSKQASRERSKVASDSKQESRDRSKVNSKQVSREKVTSALLSRANTFLRQATLSGGQGRLNTGTKPGTGQTIVTAVASLEREKTILDNKTVVPYNGEEPELDDEMKQLLLDLQKEKTAKEFTDSDFDTDLEDTEDNTTETQSKEKALYLKTCKKLGLRPIPFVGDQLTKGKDVAVLNRCMDSLDLLCLCNCLIGNPKIKRLVLDGNMIGEDGALCIAWLLTEQETHLDNISLVENGIGNEGFTALGEMLNKNKILTSLNLAGNQGQDYNIYALTEALKIQSSLTSLNLSHNVIGDIGAEMLASAIAANDGLTYLDLSWNKIRPNGGAMIASALKENITLRTINLAMNGLTTRGAVVLSDTLKKNETLTYLNISYNRIFDEGCAYLAKGMEKNEKLHHLILHNNPITASGAITLLSGIRNNKSTGMWKLDLQTTPVVKECDEIAAEISYHNGGDFELRHAGLVDSEVNVLSTENKLDHRNPMAVVKNYVEEEGLRMIDFFKQMDKDHGGSISREEFVEGLALAQVPLSQGQIDKLIDMLDKDGDGEIDYGELVEGDRTYKRTILKKKMEEMEIIKEALAKANQEKAKARKPPAPPK